MTAPQAALKRLKLSNSLVALSAEVPPRAGGNCALHVSHAHVMPLRHLLYDSPLLHPVWPSQKSTVVPHNVHTLQVTAGSRLQHQWGCDDAKELAGDLGTDGDPAVLGVGACPQHQPRSPGCGHDPLSRVCTAGSCTRPDPCSSESV